MKNIKNNMGDHKISGVRKGQFLMVLAGLAWGSSFPAVKWGLEFIHPVIFVFLRFLPASLLAILFVRYFGTSNAPNFLKDRRVIILGVLNAFGYFFQFIGMVFTTAGKASLLINMNVVIVALLSFVFLGESMGWQKIIAIIISVFGVVLITTDGNFQTLFSGSFLGDFIVILGGVVWSIYIVYSKKLLNDSQNKGLEINSMDLSSAVITITMLFLILPTIIYGIYDPYLFSNVLSIEAIIAVFYTGFVCTTIALTIYYIGLKYVSASVSAVILLVEIVFAVLLAFIFLNEVPSFYTIIGGVLIGSAIYQVSKENKK